MIFNSLEFAFFLPTVFALYWFFRNNYKAQNSILLAASFFFYGCWDWRFLVLLFFSIFLDYFTGLRIFKSKKGTSKKFWLYTSIIVNLGFLFFFKYFNFFINSFSELVSQFGIYSDVWVLKILLPIGISFYTFHGLSYVIDIYRGRTTPTSNLVDYALFVSFFPLLIAGPIERATHLLPQIQKPRHFNLSDASDGLRQILWGLFKKIVIADGCAVVANTVFSSPEELNGSTLLLGAVMFSFQIYGDFSGYSDMALGIAKLFGFDLLKNFSYPYFSRDIAEFWRRWHISLSSWFKDYVYIPLGGSKQGKKKAIRNTFIIFLLSGFWHGANWTFVIWGGLHALYFLPLLLSNKNRKNIDLVAKDSLLPSAKEFFQIVITFFLVTFAWIFFRAESLHQAIVYISGIFSFSLFQTPTITPKLLLLVLLIFIIIEWKGRSYSYALANMGTKWSTPVRWAMYCLIGLIILVLKGASQQFIYFQF